MKFLLTVLAICLLASCATTRLQRWNKKFSHTEIQVFGQPSFDYHGYMFGTKDTIRIAYPGFIVKRF